MLQIVRYGLVGVATNVLMYFVYLLITHLGIEPKTTMSLVYLVGASFGFIGHKRWAFAHEGGTTGAALRYAIAHVFGYFLNFLILFIFVDHLGYAHQWVQAGAIAVVAGFLFIVFKYIVFRSKVVSTRKA
jgi:putative flippase GtrA